MIQRRWNCRQLLATLSLGVLSACSPERVAGGNSSETPNTVAGRLVDNRGRVRIGDTVTIRPAQWTSADLLPLGPDPLQLTDSLGGYRFDGLAAGAYVVESRGAASGFLSEPVIVGQGRPVVDLGVDTAFGFQDIAGRVVADSGAIEPTAQVHICGTSHVAAVDKSGAFRFAKIGPGAVRLLAVMGSSQSAARAADAFRLLPQGLVAPRLLAPSRFEDEDYLRWPREHRARIRFSARGWYLDSDQPLSPIRVRLDASSLPGIWEPTGAGIRFSDSVGNRLAYQIESWDPVARRAEVWVRLELANKGSDAHLLRLFWGRTDVPDRSDGRRVFDTAQGWVGVWHLSGPDPWKDATANRLQLVATAVSAGSGLIAGGAVLAPASRLEVRGAALQGMQEVAVSVWARVDSARSRANLVRLGNPQISDSSDWTLGLVDSSGQVSSYFQTRGLSGVAVQRGGMAIGSWTSLGGIITRTSPRLRLVRDDSASVLVWRDSFALHAVPNGLVIGGGFSGQIDEIRLRKTGVHPDELRLQWGADRDGSPVLEWLP